MIKVESFSQVLTGYHSVNQVIEQQQLENGVSLKHGIELSLL